MRSVNFELQISEKKCALYTGKYGTCLASATFCHLFLELERLSKRSSVCFLNACFFHDGLQGVPFPDEADKLLVAHIDPQTQC